MKINPYKIIPIVLLSSCYPVAKISNQVNHDQIFTKVPAFISVTDSEALNTYDPIFLADIKTRINGYTINCNLDNQIRIIREATEKLGGNCVLIENYTPPRAWKNGCEGLHVKAFFVKNYSELETEIEWNENRKLTCKDFKGSTENRPYKVSASTGIQYYSFVEKNETHASIAIQSVFDCERSYFKNCQDSALLKLEQINFNLTEIYARKFARILDTEILNLNDLISSHESIYNEVVDSLVVTRDKFRAQIQTDSTSQLLWSEHVERELIKLEKYKSKIVKIPRR